MTKKDKMVTVQSNKFSAKAPLWHVIFWNGLKRVETNKKYKPEIVQIWKDGSAICH
jgi:hypothetical protein